MNDINQSLGQINSLHSLVISEFAIGWIAILISIVSVIFAFRSYIESKKANRISIHPIQIEIYDAFNDLHINFRTNKIFTDINKSTEFYKFTEKSEFYFDETLSKQLRGYFDIYRRLFILKSRYNANIDVSDKSGVIKSIFEDVDKLLYEEELLYEQIKEPFRNVLKISGFKQ